MVAQHGLEVDLQITNRCPLNCDHCVYNSNPHENLGLSFEVIERLCRELKQLNAEQVSITGGEPFVRKDLLSVIATIANHGMEVCVQTSGLLSRAIDFCTLRDTGLSLLLVSIDGPADYHNQFRHRDGLFDRACETVASAATAGLPVRINTVVTKSNVNRVLELLPHAEALGVGVFSFFYFSPLGRGALHAQEMLSFSDWRRFEHQVRDWQAAHPQTSMRIKLQSVAVSADELPSPGQRCRIAARDNILILANGEVYPCVFVCHQPDLCVGNIYRDSLVDLWRHSPAWSHAFEPLFQIAGKDCASSGHAGLNCNGGCPALRRLLRRPAGFCDTRCEWSGSGLVPGCAREYVPLN